LKIAAGSKAEVIEAAMKQRYAWKLEVCTEFGTFVGFTAVRLARWVASSTSSPGHCVGLEVDPVHALITRHNLSLSQLGHVADVWIGQALDIIPRLPEDIGTVTLALTFMDHRGTKFHSDLFGLQKHGMLPPGAVHVCDNVLKPGAPLCMWLTAYNSDGFMTTNLSMNEFAHWNSEDWMLVNVFS